MADISQTRNHNIVCTHRWLSLCRGYQDEPYMVSSPGTFIVPINEIGEVMFIMEPTKIDGQRVLTLPGGAVDEDEDWAISANRELQEEIGYRAGRLDYLGMFTPMARVTDWQVHLYLGRDLTESKLAGDEAYEISIERIPLANLEQLIASRRLTDVLIIGLLYITRSFLAAETK